MCFSQSGSLIVGLTGICFSLFLLQGSNKKRVYAAIGITYFSLMEILQFFQYQVIDDCTAYNERLTLLGYLHICFQPFFVNVWQSALCLRRRTMWRETGTLMWSDYLLLLRRTTHCVECSTTCTREVLVYTQYWTTFFHVGHASTGLVSDQTPVRASSDRPLRGVSKPKHPRTTRHLVLYRDWTNDRDVPFIKIKRVNIVYYTIV